MKRNLAHCAGPTSAFDFIEIALIAGREIVEPHHALIELEQGLQQIRADEAGDAGDQPGFRAPARSSLAKLFVSGHRRLRLQTHVGVFGAENVFQIVEHVLRLCRSARIASAPMARNWSCATARMMAS